MGGHSPEDIKKETRTYIMVFVALAALTMITVAVSYLDLGTAAAISVAMVVAMIKGSLVAAFFMHLIDEEKLIYAVLVLTVVFFAVLFVLPAGTFADSTGEGFVMEGVQHPESGAEH